MYRETQKMKKSLEEEHQYVHAEMRLILQAMLIIAAVRTVACGAPKSTAKLIT